MEIKSTLSIDTRNLLDVLLVYNRKVKEKKMKKKGFTLVELLVVIAILAILATVSIVGYTQFITKAKKNVAMQECTQVRDLIIAEDINNADFSIADGVTYRAAHEAVYYTQEQANAANATHLVKDSNNKQPSEEGYVTTYEDGYTAVTTSTVKDAAVTEIDELKVIQAAISTDANGLGAKLSYPNADDDDHTTLTYTCSNGETCTWDVTTGEIDYE